jgi:hypothetical protein
MLTWISNFNNNEVTITLSNNDIKNNSNYFGTATEKSNFDINQAGGVFVFKIKIQAAIEKVLYRRELMKIPIILKFIFSAGTNPNNSVDGYF